MVIAQASILFTEQYTNPNLVRSPHRPINDCIIKAYPMTEEQVYTSSNSSPWRTYQPPPPYLTLVPTRRPSTPDPAAPASGQGRS
jgi:hypothetical protein